MLKPRLVLHWPLSDLDGGKANFCGTDHHTITAKLLGGILHDALTVGSASLVPTLQQQLGRLQPFQNTHKRLHRGSQGPSGYKVALEESGMQESENSLFGRAANETTQILTLRHSFFRLFSIVAEPNARVRQV